MPTQPDTTELAASPADLVVPVPALRRSKPGKHAAPLIRPQLLPGLLLVSASAAFTGLAALPSTTVSPVSAAEPESEELLAIGGPEPFATITVNVRPPLPAPVVQAKIQAKEQAVATAATPAEAVKAAPKAETPLANAQVRASRSTARVQRTEFVRPCSGRLTSGYGARWGRLHAGLDFGAPTGTPIYAVTSAVVKEIKYSRSSGGYGNLTILEHSDGTLTYYAHQSKIMVSEGQAVLAGETIGLVGSTGRSTGPHLHFEVHPNGGGPINPRPWLQARGISL